MEISYLPQSKYNPTVVCKSHKLVAYWLPTGCITVHKKKTVQKKMQEILVIPWENQILYAAGWLHMLRGLKGHPPPRHIYLSGGDFRAPGF